MNRFRVPVITLLLLSYFAPASFTASTEFIDEDLAARSRMMMSISKPGYLGTALWYSLSCARSFAGYLTPECIKHALDELGAFSLDKALSSSLLRSQIERLAFASDNNIFEKYDAQYGIHRQFPNDPVDKYILWGLVQSAALERKEWQDGKFSGAIYDGSKQHAANLADHFWRSLALDPHLGHLFLQDEEASSLARYIFEHFNTANPLHGTAFPLAVKAMRELASMLADLFGAEYAIINSGSQEALRLGLKSLKQGAGKNALVFSNEDFVAKSARTLNINTKIIKPNEAQIINEQEFDFIVLDLDNTNDIDRALITAINTAKSHNVDIHIHLSNSLFLSMLANKSNLRLSNIFSISPHIHSVSFDTTGVMYAGVSATVFRDQNARFNTFEAHVNWIGGLYPGVNSAGSIAGVDYILAYVLSLWLGKNALTELAQKELDKEPTFAEPPFSQVAYENLQKSLTTNFLAGMRHKNLHDVLAHLRKGVPKAHWRDLVEKLLISVSMSIFNADPQFFSGRITSGGTESIRVAMQTYIDLFKKNDRRDKPIFLMSQTAHIAFDRHLIDNDALIVRVGTDESLALDPQDLIRLIEEYGATNIAGIIASAPSYPYGISDDIRAIAEIAGAHDIPLHVDGCLGAYLMQFVPNNPLKIDFSLDECAHITSVSGDLHKYGYTQKGESLIIMQKRILALLGRNLEVINELRSVPNLVTALACMLDLGYAGYEERALAIINVAHDFLSELKTFPEIEIVGNKRDDQVPYWVIGFRVADFANLKKEHTYSVSYLMEKLGWRLNKIGNHSLHMALTSAHVHNKQFVKKFMDDLRVVLDVLKQNPNHIPSMSTATYGMASNLPVLTIGQELSRVWLENSLKTYAENLVTTPR